MYKQQKFKAVDPAVALSNRASAIHPPALVGIGLSQTERLVAQPAGGIVKSCRKTAENSR
jgi:hypothetical protein